MRGLSAQPLHLVSCAFIHAMHFALQAPVYEVKNPCLQKEKLRDLHHANRSRRLWDLVFDLPMRLLDSDWAQGRAQN